MSDQVCVISANEISRKGLAHLLCAEGFDVVFREPAFSKSMRAYL